MASLRLRKSRGLLASAVVAATAIVVVVVAVAARDSDDDTEPPPVAISLTDFSQLADAGQYRYPVYTTDGATLVALDPGADGDLHVRAYQDTFAKRDLSAIVPSGQGSFKPYAIGALPGAAGQRWVAVARPHFVGGDEYPDRVRPRVWLSRRTDDGVDAVATPRFPVVLPVGDPPLSFAAMATVGERTIALVIVGEDAFRCDVDDCAWKRVELPGRVEGLASTGSGFVLVTDGDTRQVWHADTAAVEWSSLGDGPTRARADIVTTSGVKDSLGDTEGTVTILWRRILDHEMPKTTEPPNEADDRQDDDVAAGAEAPVDAAWVGTVEDGELGAATEPATLPDGFFQPSTIARWGDRWIVGGEQAPPFETSRTPHTGAIVYLSGDEWVFADADALAHQLYQTVASRFVNDDGDLIMVSDGIFDIRMMWRVELAE